MLNPHNLLNLLFDLMYRQRLYALQTALEIKKDISSCTSSRWDGMRMLLHSYDILLEMPKPNNKYLFICLFQCVITEQEIRLRPKIPPPCLENPPMTIFCGTYWVYAPLHPYPLRLNLSNRVEWRLHCSRGR